VGAMQIRRFLVVVSSMLVLLFPCLWYDVLADEAEECKVDARFDITVESGTDFEIAVEMDVSEITVFDVTYDREGIKTVAAENLEILGVLLTFVESRTKLSREVQRQMREHFGDLVFDTVIHKDVRLAEAPSAHEPVFSYAPDSTGAIEHKILAEEIG